MKRQKRLKRKPLDKRLVLWHCTGPLAGVMQIIGAESGLKDKQGKQRKPPTFIGPVQRPIDGETVSFSLRTAKRSYWLFKENTPPQGLGTFDAAQR